MKKAGYAFEKGEIKNLFKTFDQRKLCVFPEYKREGVKAIQIRQSHPLKSPPNPGPLQIIEPSVAYISSAYTSLE